MRMVLPLCDKPTPVTFPNSRRVRDSRPAVTHGISIMLPHFVTYRCYVLRWIGRPPEESSAGMLMNLDDSDP